MSEGIWVYPPEWKVEGGGGSGTGGAVSWGDIENKPTEFKPRPHKHELEDIITLEEILYNKVEKEIGKGLSTNDFTNEDKDKLDSLGGNASSYVQSVNSMLPDNMGNVDVTKEQLGLGKIENKEYTPLIDFENHAKDKNKHVTEELIEKIDSNTTNIARSVKKEELETEVSRLDEKIEGAESSLSVKINENSIAIQGKVDHVEGKGLSSNDFTDEDKIKLDNIISSEDKLVKTVNGKTPDNLGNIDISKEELGMENVLNIEQASKEDFDKLSAEVKNHDADLLDLSTKVQTNTNEIALINDKIDNAVFPDEIVNSVNGETGAVTIDKTTVGLSNVLDKEQATKEELEALKDSSGIALLELAKTLEGYTDKEVASEADRTNSKLMEKVDKELGKGLSTNDFTKEYKDKLDSLEKIDGIVKTVNKISPDLSGNVEVDKNSIGLGKVLNEEQASKADFDKHVEDSLVRHEELSKRVSSNTDALTNKIDLDPNKGLSTNDFTNEDKMLIETNKAEIEAIKALLGDGEEPVELPPTFKTYKEGHIYGLGGMVYDIINDNIIKGNLAPRFVYDNMELFSLPKIFKNNTINVYYDGGVDALEDINKKDSESFKGKLAGILNVQREVNHRWFLNGTETKGFGIETEFLGNVFNLPIRWNEVFDEDVKVASVGMNIDNYINFTDTETVDVSSRSLNNIITNNEFTFLDKKEYTLNFSINLTYDDSENFSKNIHVFVGMIDNKFYFTEDMEEIQKIKYTDDKAELQRMFGEEGSVYLRVSLRDNRFDSEVSRVFKEEFEYIAERQKDKINPILNNITIDHYLNQRSRLAVSKKFGTRELDSSIIANKNTPVNEDNLKNIIVSIEEPTKTYEGLIWYQIE